MMLDSSPAIQIQARVAEKYSQQESVVLESLENTKIVDGFIGTPR